ncbi:Signal transduction histidine kinase [Arthrobacter sp. 9V]|uniref:sensor histidine kinase n=1 Tax=Arthrobacter sp. 9V TaxID=2653132 RepID=UPI0012F02A87|nr:histidine kinase [Arthrobacter sp. 9V]VXB50605.1 Signal transduction histidine kinase [Arthrobacter sp. 9V]
MIKRRLGRWCRAFAYLAGELVFGFISMGLFMLAAVLTPLLLFSGGWLIAHPAVAALRWWATIARRRLSHYRGSELTADYLPLRRKPSFEERLRLVFSRRTGKDTLWLVGHGLFTPLVTVLCIGLPFAALNTLLIPTYWYLLPPDQPVSSIYPVTSWEGAYWMVPIGLGYAAVSWWLIPAVAQGSSWIQSRILAPSKSTLVERVTALTASRAAALDAHAAELKRIERDLHDGAQNRLVGVVMMLGLAERTLEKNPDEALPHVRRAQQAATEALAGLRTAVHDIHPPILDELGLEGALSALTGRSAIPCRLTLKELQRVPAALESASYFIVAEALTNANKYSAASQISVEVSREAVRPGTADKLFISVEDNGSGGALERPGGGLAGIRRRTEAFEGSARFESPAGGPTTVRVELPCEW